MADRTAIRLPGVVLILLSILAIAAEFPRALPGDWLWDFGSFLESGRAARQGLNPYAIYPLTFHVVLPGFEAWNPNLNPPISALLFQPFDWAEPHLSFRIWWVISVALYAATVVLLLRHYRNLPPLTLGLWAFALAGFWDTLVLGQIYMPLVLAGTGAWLLLERGRDVLAGILLGAVVAMKPNFAVWPALLLFSGHFRPALAAVATAALVSAIPAVVLGFEVYQQWIELLASDAERAFFLTNVSLTGLAARAHIPALGLALSFLLLAGSALWALGRQPDRMTASAVGLVVALLASPIAWIHYTLFLLPVLLWRWEVNGMRLVALLLIIPVPFVIARFGQSAWAQLTAGSVYNWAVLLCLVVLLRDHFRNRIGEQPLWKARRGGRSAPLGAAS